jgi:hypothetical protein
MSNYQECAKLKIENKFKENKESGIDNLTALMNLQKSIQENVYGYNFEKLHNGSLKELKEFIDWNESAIQDELREMYNALGGIKDGIGNAVWKPWKKDHVKAETMTLKEMSESDKLELMFEVIDLQHFLWNLAWAVGLTPESFVNLYFAKNKENIDRQKRGY